MANEDTVKTSVILPRDLYVRISAEARRQRRSANGQIVYLLEQAMPAPAPIQLPCSICQAPGLHTHSKAEVIAAGWTV